MKSYALLLAALGASVCTHALASDYDVVIRGGTVYDGTGGKSFTGDLAIKGDRIVYVGPKAPGSAAQTVDAKGKAVAPGFVNMLAHPEDSIVIDGRALSDLAQGVTLEVMGEDSMGPLNDKMKADFKNRQIDIHYDVDWTTLGEYLTKLEKRGISPNIASYVGAATVRVNVLGENDVQPNAEQLTRMKALVHDAMEEGAMGVTTALIYAPNTYAKTDELKALAGEAARCGGIYSAHMRNEGDRIESAIQETIDIAQASGGAAEIYHFKLAGKRNWGKLDAAVKIIEDARKRGVRLTADMYTYTAGAAGLDATMPRWVQDGGLEAWIQHLKDPATRAKVIAEMRDPHPKDWENTLVNSGPEGVLFLQFKNPALKKYTGRRLADVAKELGKSPEDTIIDLVIEDGSRVGVVYFMMSEDNVRRQVALPWMSFDSDEAGDAPEGVFLKSNAHPRAYGSFVRVIGHYVRDEKVLSMEQAIHQLAGLPTEVLSIPDRGHLKVGNYADVVVFDPATVTDHATYEKPHQLATGVDYVFVNGVAALKDGKPTGLPSGRFVKGRAAKSGTGGGCKADAKDWKWHS